MKTHFESQAAVNNDQTDIQALCEGKLIYRNSKLCMTKDLGLHGNMFGGKMMAMLDEVASIFASEICDTPSIVTKKIEEVIFERPVKVGQIIKIYCGIQQMGNTSISLRVEARVYNVYTEIEKLVCSTRMLFVKIDNEGNAIPISDRVKAKFNKITSEQKS
jgi:acyl-CoA thioesterase YciA